MIEYVKAYYHQIIVRYIRFHTKKARQKNLEFASCKKLNLLFIVETIIHKDIYWMV